MPDYHPNAQKLADALMQRWKDLDRRTLGKVAELGGISEATVTRYRMGRVSVRPGGATLRGLDLGSDWPPGTSMAILEGKEPPTETNSHRPVLQNQDPLAAQAQEMLHAHLRVVETTLKAFRDLTADNADARLRLDAVLQQNQTAMLVLQLQKQT